MIDLPKGVKFCNLTKEKALYFWNKVKGYDKLFTDDVRWDEISFYERLYHPNTVLLEEENGLLILSDLKPGFFTTVHVVFWDHKLSVRTGLLKDCLVWVFQEYNLQRIEAVIPEFSRTLKRFIEKLGFRYEGTLRKRLLFKGQFYDTIVYSILREEL
jgi:hypothetical protein